MEAVQKDHWYLVVLILLLFLKVSVPQKDAVSTVHLEEGMVLSCLCPWTGNLSMVSWTKVPDKNPLAVFHPEYGVALSHHYYERVEFLRTTPMDGSISMRNVTHQDIGIYQCSVQTFPRGSWTRTIQVEDLDEPPEEETTDLPSDDVIEMDAEQNNNLTISCNHEHNGTVYQVIVEKMPHGQPWTIIGVCKVVDGDLVVEDYSDRGRVSCAHSLDVSLQLTDVVEEDKGFYRCSFSTDAGMQTTTVLLTVPTPGGISLSLYMMYVYIAAGGAVLVLLIVIITLTEEEQESGVQSQTAPASHTEMEAAAQGVTAMQAVALGQIRTRWK
ncbi:CD226 antigen isoform X2 [Thalassophryne amazonica]|uniref:CD226 antigen isoform X2 n=1 Tax=Thalassophryne amazonica TaxID=390379 RepID=UPI0014708834|nr:CD226 antigen isoform X2 [Thalassophryne amazonica]